MCSASVACALRTDAAVEESSLRYDDTMSGQLRGRVAVITGASAGIGRATAEHLASEGMSLALGARRGNRLAEVDRIIEGRGARTLTVETDVTRESDVQALVEAAVDTFGRLDAVICNAGIGFHGTLEETETSVMARLMDVNFMGTYYTARAAIPHLKQSNHGHIVIVSSIVGHRGIPCMSAYAATKFAQVGFAESLRSELGKTRVRVTTVCPVATDTEFFEAVRQNFGTAFPGVGPRQSADHVARAIVKALEHPRPEVFPYPKARLLDVLNAVAPGFCDRLVWRYRRGQA